MSRAGFGACPACGNHFRIADGACPFCADHDAAGGRGLLIGLGRAGLVAGALLAAPACGDDTPAADVSDAISDTSADTGPTDATAVDTSEVADDPTIVPLYGPPPQDTY
ncbi:MAG: hypothetical protein U1F43_05920 [Myxococcota bacterium]